MQDKETITFELAAHFLPKIALRFEHLYRAVQEAITETHPIIHTHAIQSIIEILSLIQKPELKSRFLKELVRIEHKINKKECVLTPELDRRLYAQVQVLTYVVGCFGDAVQRDPFLQAVRLSLASPLSIELDTPLLHFWLHTSAPQRQKNLQNWLVSLRDIHDTASVYLAILRHSSLLTSLQSSHGFYQCPLPPSNDCHLIAITIAKSYGIVPQMQIGHHRLSVHFFEANSMREVPETHLGFGLAICRL